MLAYLSHVSSPLLLLAAGFFFLLWVVQRRTSHRLEEMLELEIRFRFHDLTAILEALEYIIERAYGSQAKKDFDDHFHYQAGRLNRHA
jgi:hypothetical protein